VAEATPLSSRSPVNTKVDWRVYVLDDTTAADTLTTDFRVIYFASATDATGATALITWEDNVITLPTATGPTNVLVAGVI
jgi:hypothetical protein